MTRQAILTMTALAPAIWGTTYLVTTEMLPDGHPFMASMLRALPAGLLLVAITRQLPPRNWLLKIAVLGGLNFAVFWSMLFVAAYRLPGGLAATLIAVQPLMVLVLSSVVLGTRVGIVGFLAALAGIAGVGLLVLGPDVPWDTWGIAAALTATVSMGAGTVMARKWQPPVSPLTFTGWQLSAGGLLLLPVALIVEPNWPMPTALHMAGYLWLGIVGAAVTYFFWFRGIAMLGPSVVTVFNFFSPLTAALLGWFWLEQSMTTHQLVGAGVILGSVWLGQRAGRRV